MSLLGTRPLADQFTLVSIDDPALDRERLDAEHAADPTKSDFADAFKRAGETQDWSPLLKPNERATVFHFRPLVGKFGQRLQDMVGSGAVGYLEGSGLAFRMAVTQIEGWGPPLPKFERKRDPEFTQLGDMFSTECFAALCERTGNALVVALGMAVINRSQHLSPP